MRRFSTRRPDLVANVFERCACPDRSAWLAGEFELVVSEGLLAELERALAYPELGRRVSVTDAAEFVGLLRSGGILAPDPATIRAVSADPGDDDLVALAEQERAMPVSGDRHLLVLADRFPVQAPGAFLDQLVG